MKIYIVWCATGDGTCGGEDYEESIEAVFLDAERADLYAEKMCADDADLSDYYVSAVDVADASECGLGDWKP